MSYLIEKDGERQFVKSLKGYEGWKKIDGKAPVEDDTEARMNATIGGMTRRDLIEQIEAIIAERMK